MSEHGHTQPLDAPELLSTKLAPPRPHADLVSRERLIERLDEGLEHKLTLLSAPAGFGKTTLVSEWIAARSGRQELLPVAWVSLDAGDNDPARFWRYVITACRAFSAALGESALALLRTSRRISFEAVVTTFINELAQLEHRGVLVLDDYHFITSAQVREAMAFLVEHLPATLRLLILTRSDPALPLARLRAHDDLYELGAADLRFSLEEARAFLQQALPFPLSAETVARLETRTEGWVTGLRLLALALQGRQDQRDLERMLATFTGSHRHVLEYLVADVLSSQPEALQEFLLQTAFLNRLTASLCNAVTQRNDSEDVLEQLERANLFLIPLDDVGQWYRYHALFAEAMQHEARRRLGEASLRSLYDRASHWFEQQGLLAEAVEVALSSREFARAAALIEDIMRPDGAMSELLTLFRWVEQLPEEVLREHPTLCLYYATGLLFFLDRSDPATAARTQPLLEMAERRWQAEGNAPRLGEALGFRSQLAWWQGDIAQAIAAADQSLELLPEQETFWRASSTLTVGIREMLAGNIDAAREAFLEARAIFESVGNVYGVRAARLNLGEVADREGELHQAARLYRQLYADAAEDPLDMAHALIGLAALSYEWNELAEAEQQVSQALDIGKQHADVFGKHLAEQFVMVPGSLVHARILHARGEAVQARQLLQELLVLTQGRNWRYLHREVLAELARYSLAVADLAQAQRWSAAITQLGEDFRLVQQEREAYIFARLLIAQGETASALSLLERWQAEARTQKRLQGDIEAGILASLAHFAHRDLSRAGEKLKEALALALPEGYRRLFLDEGEAQATLLRTVLLDVREEALAAYIRDLLLAFARRKMEQDVLPRSAPGLLVEPLSAQEQRVLRLLAAGHSNPEIAQELVVSVNTVKTQVQSIYRKLNVKSRWEAGEAARRLKLL